MLNLCIDLGEVFGGAMRVVYMYSGVMCVSVGCGNIVGVGEWIPLEGARVNCVGVGEGVK